MHVLYMKIYLYMLSFSKLTLNELLVFSHPFVNNRNMIDIFVSNLTCKTATLLASSDNAVAIHIQVGLFMQNKPSVCFIGCQKFARLLHCTVLQSNKLL